jgi:surfeit locus 1 family protein
MRAGVAEIARPPEGRGPKGPFRITGRGIVAAAFVLVIVAVCVRLGFWQLDRQAQRDHLNEALASAMEQPPLELRGGALAQVLADPESFAYRRVVLEGSYDTGGEVVLRGRALGGNPGVNLVTPLVLTGERVAVLVNRGWVASPDASTVEPGSYREPGLRRVEGMLLPLGRGGETREVVRSGDGGDVRSVQRLDADDPRFAPGRDLLPLLVQQLSATEAGEATSAPASPVRLPAPAIDPGPHLGYAMQWFSFAAIALIGFGLVLHLSRRGRF